MVHRGPNDTADTGQLAMRRRFGTINAGPLVDIGDTDASGKARALALAALRARCAGW